MVETESDCPLSLLFPSLWLIWLWLTCWGYQHAAGIQARLRNAARRLIVLWAALCTMQASGDGGDVGEAIGQDVEEKQWRHVGRLETRD